MVKEPGESGSRLGTTRGGISRTVTWTGGAAEGGAETEGESWTEGRSETGASQTDKRDERWSGVEPTVGGEGDASAYTVTITSEASDEAGKALSRQSWTVTAATAAAIRRLIEQDGSPGASVGSEAGSRLHATASRTRTRETIATEGAAEGGAETEGEHWPETEGETWSEEMPEALAEGTAGSDEAGGSPEYRPTPDADKKKPGAGAPGAPPEAGSSYDG